MKYENVRDILIERTITVIANDGLDKTTTKRIVTGTGINESYIYRNFTDKEELLAKTFDALDGDLADKALQHVSVMYMQEFDFETRCRLFFSAMWMFLVGNRDKCLAYMSYFYSPYFIRYSADAHKERFTPLLKEFKPAFREEADVWMILNHILNVMLDFAVKVHNNQMPNDDDYVEHVFRVIYYSVKLYFKDD